MAKTIMVTLHRNEEVAVVCKRKYVCSYDDCWDMLRDLQDWFGCLPWQYDDEMQFVAYLNKAKNEYFLATYYND